PPVQSVVSRNEALATAWMNPTRAARLPGLLKDPKKVAVSGWHLGGCCLALSCYSPPPGRDVVLQSSSSGGGLPGRPATQPSFGALVIFVGVFGLGFHDSWQDPIP